MTFLMMLSNYANYADDTTLYSKCDHDLNLNLIYKTLWTGVKMVLLISMLGKLKWFCLAGLIAMVLLM